MRNHRVLRSGLVLGVTLGLFLAPLASAQVLHPAAAPATDKQASAEQSRVELPDWVVKVKAPAPTVILAYPYQPMHTDASDTLSSRVLSRVTEAVQSAPF